MSLRNQFKLNTMQMCNASIADDINGMMELAQYNKLIERYATLYTVCTGPTVNDDGGAT